VPSTSRATIGVPPWNAAAYSIALEIIRGMSMIAPCNMNPSVARRFCAL
jgi:hypothetical protein